MLELLIGDMERIDFDSPIELTKKQFEQFKEGMEKIYDKRAIIYCPCSESELRESRLGEYFPYLDWDNPAEIEILLEPIPTEEKSRLSGRPYMSIRMQETFWLPEYLEWRKNKKGLEGKLEREKIKLFLLEQKLEKQKRAEKRRKVVLLQCSECGTYHDPRNKQWTFCNICAESLREVRVSRQERKELYSKQPESKAEFETSIKEMLRAYPYIEETD